MAALATLILTNAATRDKAVDWVRRAKPGSVVAFRGPRRTLPQNDKLHAMITDVAMQKDWPVGSGIKRDIEAWKDIFTAALRSANHGLDVVPGLNGGFVLLGMHTSQMTKEECGELMDLIDAWAAENGVSLSEAAKP